MHESFGTRLRNQRERRKVSLATIAEETKIHQPLLEALERDEITRWPSGIFRRAFIRSYAQAIGLQADDVVREFLTLYPDPIESAAVEPPPRAPWWRRLVGHEDVVARSAEASRSEMEPVARRLQPSDDEDVARVLDSAGMIAWAWDPGMNALVPAMAAGYSDRVLAQLPRVHRDADNATAAAFRSESTCTVPGLEGMNGALAVPIMRGRSCTGVLAVELPDGTETSQAMRTAVTLLARQIGRLVDLTRLSREDRYARPVLRRVSALTASG
jgi:transcriptional regulator with XRE-family HTH domain